MHTEPSPDEIDIPIKSLRARRGRKWSRYGPDVFPAWIADMDFQTAQPIQTALSKLLAEQDYGYPDRDGDIAERALAQAFAAYEHEHNEWTPDPLKVIPVADLVQGIFTTILAFTEPGDGVLLHLPAYGPFLEAINTTGRVVVGSRLVAGQQRWESDYENLEALAKRAKAMLLCNPHNPTGRVFDREELEFLDKVALENDLVVISDEVHSGLVYPGKRHLSAATVSKELAERTVTLTSAAKSFNIAGLRCAVMHFGSRQLYDRFIRRFPERSLGHLNVFGIDATLAAWGGGERWLSNVKRRLITNRTHMTNFIQGELPDVLYREPEATYFAWLSLEAHNLDPSPQQFLLEKARVATTAGGDFGKGYEQFVRINFATSPSILDAMLDRIRIVLR